MSLFGGNKLHVAVFTDFAHGEKRKVDGLRRSNLLRSGRELRAQVCATPWLMEVLASPGGAACIAGAIDRT
jgi:hypothetical protein